jgi:hypothetical protein
LKAAPLNLVVRQPTPNAQFNPPEPSITTDKMGGVTVRDVDAQKFIQHYVCRGILRAHKMDINSFAGRLLEEAGKAPNVGLLFLREYEFC